MRLSWVFIGNLFSTTNPRKLNKFFFPAPKCTGENEEFISTRFTEATCDEPVAERCGFVEECRCKPGFVRHQGKCIKSCDCRKWKSRKTYQINKKVDARIHLDILASKCPGPNEEYIWTSVGERTCGEPTPAPCTRVKECRCLPNYVRHNGKCIKPSQCREYTYIYIHTIFSP